MMEEFFPEKCSEEKESETFPKNIKTMTSFVKELEDSLLESTQNDRKMMLMMQTDNLKNQKLSSQLEEARKENKQLMNVLQQKFGDQNLSRMTSRTNLDSSSSYSTVSMVNLQYKYEELLLNYEGLLKVLESKSQEINKCYLENNHLQDQIKNVTIKLTECQHVTNKLCRKYLTLKQKKNAKISALKNECETLRLAHDNMVNMLNKYSLEQDKELEEMLRKTVSPRRAVLLKEIRKTNSLQHENILLRQEIGSLKFRLGEINNPTNDYSKDQGVSNDVSNPAL